MTKEEHEEYVDMRNACYRKRSNRNRTINYFTGFDDGFEQAKKQFIKQIEKISSSRMTVIKYAILYTNRNIGCSDYFNGFRKSINDNRIFMRDSKSIYLRKSFKVWKKKENAEKMIETIKNTISNPEDYKFSIEKIEE